jgi:hypothetical protein
LGPIDRASFCLRSRLQLKAQTEYSLRNFVF